MVSRRSPLAQAQVNEVEAELHRFAPQVRFMRKYMTTRGDRDQVTSLRSMGKTDFFTRELDQLVLARGCDVAIHSAKDLPDPLPEGLQLVALTRGVNPSDSLVLRSGCHLEMLPSGSVIATSSERREEAVRQLRSDFLFEDVRGTIGQRLAKLEAGEVSGVVIATAALIRLDLTHLNSIELPGETVPFQGRLAVVAHREDQAMREVLIECVRERDPAGPAVGIALGLHLLDVRDRHPRLAVRARRRRRPRIAVHRVA